MLAATVPTPTHPARNISAPEALPAQETFSLSSIDAEGFLQALQALRQEINADLGERDIAHLRKMEWWGRGFTALGLLTAGIAPNPVSMVSLALGRNNRWVLMHHIAHRGYDKVPNIPKRYTSKVFGRGWRRFLDWPDWANADAWHHEHNILHHAHTADMGDPDLIERNTALLREMGLPMTLRYASMASMALLWRPGLYAPNALRAWKERHKDDQSDAGDYSAQIILKSFLDPDYWRTGLLPYSALQFVAMPLLYAPFGPWAMASALINSLGAELVASIHSFVVVLPNHCGDDLYRYDIKPDSRAERIVRQIVSSANYSTESDWQGFAQLWLNYQIEHHVWPDLPMLRYREVQPKLKDLCAQYGVPYTQQSLWRRVRRMADVVVGKTAMQRVDSLHHG